MIIDEEKTKRVNRLKNKWLKSTCKKAEENILYLSPLTIDFTLNLYLSKKFKSLKPFSEKKNVIIIITKNID